MLEVDQLRKDYEREFYQFFKNKQLKNVPQSKENWLSKIDNWKIILAFISLAITVFTGGYQYKQHERNNDIFDLKKENQKLHEANESLTITLRKLTAQPAKQNITRHEK